MTSWRKEKKKLVNILGFLLISYIFNSVFFILLILFHMGELSLQIKPEKVKKKSLRVEVTLYIEFQTKTSVNIWLCRCIATLLGLTALHWMCSWVKEQIAFVFLILKQRACARDQEFSILDPGFHQSHLHKHRFFSSFHQRVYHSVLWFKCTRGTKG